MRVVRRSGASGGRGEAEVRASTLHGCQGGSRCLCRRGEAGLEQLGQCAAIAPACLAHLRDVVCANAMQMQRGRRRGRLGMKATEEHPDEEAAVAGSGSAIFDFRPGLKAIAQSCFCCTVEGTGGFRLYIVWGQPPQDASRLK
jgi:hypothetical protein